MELVTMSRPVTIEEMVKRFKARHTTSHMFKIDNFSLLYDHGIEYLDSSYFDLGGHKWALRVIPKWRKKDHVSLCLYSLCGNNLKVPLQFELFVISQLTPTWHTPGKQEIGGSTNWGPESEGIYDFISVADLKKKGYLIGDSCMFGVKFHGIKPAKSGTAESISLEEPVNNRFSWKISNFSSLDPEKDLQSRGFRAGNRKWRMEVRPRENGIEEWFHGPSPKDKSLCLYLLGDGFFNKVPVKHTLVKFKLMVLDQVNENHLEETFTEVIGPRPVCDMTDLYCSSENFMPLKKLKKPYLVKDSLHVAVEFQLVAVSTYC